jgi:sortase (surface protein transpeptidase)
MVRPRPALIVLVVSALALGASVAVIAAAGPDRVDSVGSADRVALAGTSPAPAADTPAVSEARPSPSGSSVATGWKAAGFPAERTDATVLPERELIPAPVRIEIPVIGVDTAIDPIGVDSAGRVDVPKDVTRAGWYRWSPAPGASEGSSLVTAHVDGVDQGAGVFYDLKLLAPGDTVTIRRADGSRLDYRVIAREVFNKTVVPLDEIHARSGPHRLTLVTCGGPFDPETLVYTDNVVVTAVPV